MCLALIDIICHDIGFIVPTVATEEHVATDRVVVTV